MKKSFLILIFSLLSLSLILNLVMAQDETFPGTGINTEQVAGQVENITNVANKGWGYIGQELQKMALGSPVVKEIDSFLQKISIVFFVLFGMQYSLSMGLFFTIFLWLYFFFMFRSIFKNFASFSKWISSIISFLLVVIMAHIKIFELQVNLIMWLFFGDKPWWLKFIFAIVAVGVLAIAFILISFFGKQIRANRKKMKEELNRLKLEMAGKSGEELAKALARFS